MTEERNYLKTINEGGYNSWMDAYLEFTKCCESPERFHFWTGVSTIAGCLDRRVYWNQGYAKVFANQFIILVARSGGLKKTAACEIGTDLLYGVSKVNILASKMTPEALLVSMDKWGKNIMDSTAFVYAEELSVFMGPQSVSSGLISILTELYNAKKAFPYSTKNSGKFLVTNACLNILGATTPQGLRSSMPSESLVGGFAGRCVFVTASKSERCIPQPHKIMPSHDEHTTLKRYLLEDLIHISKMEGEYKFDSEASDWYDEWYEKKREDEYQRDTRLESYNDRRHTTLIKLCMVVSTSRGRDFIMTLKDIQDSLTLLKTIEPNMKYAFEGVTHSDSTRHVDRIQRQIQVAKSIYHSKLVRKNYSYMTSAELSIQVATLEAAGIVEIQVTKGGKRIYHYIDQEEGGEFGE